jgi:hypothetical protein
MAEVVTKAARTSETPQPTRTLSGSPIGTESLKAQLESLSVLVSPLP